MSRSIGSITISHPFIPIFQGGHIHPRKQIGKLHPLWHTEPISELVQPASEIRTVQRNEEGFESRGWPVVSYSL
jgi:hypothetical protein